MVAAARQRFRCPTASVPSIREPCRTAATRARQLRGSLARRGTVKVECQRCSQVSSVGLFDLLKSQLPMGIWLPRGRFDRRMTCPACRKRSWCSVTLRRG